MQKKVLGLSFGRKMKNTEILVKKALQECADQGHDIEFIRVDELDIRICTGCISCVVGLTTGRGKGKCHIQDEFSVLEEAILSSDAIIIGCPTYETSPTGRFKTVCDRLGPSHDITFIQAAIDKGLAEGKTWDQLPDQRFLKPRIGALISVGGAMTQNWLAFNLPIMYEMTMPMGIDVIDKFEHYGAMAHEHVVGVSEMMERAGRVGRNIHEALQATSDEERTRWRGADEGICPVCHCDLLQVSHKKKEVSCPVCGIYGELDIIDGEIEVNFSQEEINRSRLLYEGKLEHSTEIKTCAVGPGQIPNLKELLEPWKAVGAK